MTAAAASVLAPGDPPRDASPRSSLLFAEHPRLLLLLLSLTHGPARPCGHPLACLTTLLKCNASTGGFPGFQHPLGAGFGGCSRRRFLCVQVSCGLAATVTLSQAVPVPAPRPSRGSGRRFSSCALSSLPSLGCLTLPQASTLSAPESGLILSEAR